MIKYYTSLGFVLCRFLFSLLRTVHWNWKAIIKANPSLANSDDTSTTTNKNFLYLTHGLGCWLGSSDDHDEVTDPPCQLTIEFILCITSVEWDIPDVDLTCQLYVEIFKTDAHGQSTRSTIHSRRMQLTRILLTVMRSPWPASSQSGVHAFKPSQVLKGSLGNNETDCSRVSCTWRLKTYRLSAKWTRSTVSTEVMAFR